MPAQDITQAMEGAIVVPTSYTRTAFAASLKLPSQENLPVPLKILKQVGRPGCLIIQLNPRLRCRHCFLYQAGLLSTSSTETSTRRP